jgi:heme-degrading monooxygenase HmoA
MVTVGMNYKVREGKGPTFEKTFKSVLGAMQGMKGHVKSALYSDVADRNSYLIMSEWNDRAAFDAFIASEQFRNVANWGKEEILAGRPQHQYYGDEAPAAAKPAASTAPGRCPMGH